MENIVKVEELTLNERIDFYLSQLERCYILVEGDNFEISMNLRSIKETTKKYNRIGKVIEDRISFASEIKNYALNIQAIASNRIGDTDNNLITEELIENINEAAFGIGKDAACIAFCFKKKQISGYKKSIYENIDFIEELLVTLHENEEEKSIGATRKNAKPSS